MTTVDDVQKFLDEGWTVLSWSDEDGVTYNALAIHPTETTQHAMEQENQMGRGGTLSEALCCLVGVMGKRPKVIAAEALLGVVRQLVEWDEQWVRRWAAGKPKPVGSQSPLPKELVDEARTALVLAEREGVGE